MYMPLAGDEGFPYLTHANANASKVISDFLFFLEKKNMKAVTSLRRHYSSFAIQAELPARGRPQHHQPGPRKATFGWPQGSAGLLKAMTSSNLERTVVSIHGRGSSQPTSKGSLMGAADPLFRASLRGPQ